MPKEKTKKIPDTHYYDGRQKKWKFENIKHGKIQRPDENVMKFWLKQWDEKDGYIQQENALDKLFNHLCPANKELNDILIKCCTLNDFYSTNIYKVYKIAEIIQRMQIDLSLIGDRDTSLVGKLCSRVKKETGRNVYSFATKYMSHHRPELYPIYDSFVGKLLKYFRDNEGLKEVCNFSNKELENYDGFCKIIDNFRKFYGLERYSLKEIDKLLWQMGKYHFPKYENEEK